MKKTMCIDVGGTRIKSAVLPENPSFQQARNAPHLVIRTLGWLNHSLPSLLDPDYWPSLAAHYARKGVAYDAVAMSVPGVIDIDGQIERPDLVDGSAKMPKQLLAALEKRARCPVTLVNDADAWMLGFQVYAAESGYKGVFPAVLLAFGTGFGVSAATGSGDVVSIEAAKRPAHKWPNLKLASGFNITEGHHVHQIIGKRFFEHVESAHREWDHLAIRAEYTKRVKAALDDMISWIERTTGKIRTVVLTGGNAEYISVRGMSEGDRKVIVLTDRECGISPDRISILGVEASRRKPRATALQ